MRFTRTAPVTWALFSNIVDKEWASTWLCLQRKYKIILTKRFTKYETQNMFSNIVAKSARIELALGSVCRENTKRYLKNFFFYKIRNTKYDFKLCRKVGKEWGSTQFCLQRKYKIIFEKKIYKIRNAKYCFQPLSQSRPGMSLHSILFAENIQNNIWKKDLQNTKHKIWLQSRRGMSLHSALFA